MQVLQVRIWIGSYIRCDRNDCLMLCSLTSKKKFTPINFDNFPIQSIDNFLNIGVIFDFSFNMYSFINNKIRKSNFQLFRISGIRKSLTFLERKTLVTVLYYRLLTIVVYYCLVYQLTKLNHSNLYWDRLLELYSTSYIVKRIMT